MDQCTKQLIQERARAIADRAIYVLRNEDPEYPAAGEAFKYIFLVLRGPAQYLHKFGVSNLTIDIDEFAEFVWQMRTELPGPPETMAEELSLIEEHNAEVKTLLTEKRHPALASVR